jgi:hypothetical protein
VHDVGREAPGGDRRGREADAVDGDRVALGELGGELGRERQADAVSGALDRRDGAEARNKSSENGYLRGASGPATVTKLGIQPSETTTTPAGGR